MLTASCACGAKYRVPESAAGKKARCKKCGDAFHIPAADVFELEPLPLGAFDDLGRGAAIAPPVDLGEAHAQTARFQSDAEHEAKAAPRGMDYAGYVDALSRSLFFFRDWGSLIIFGIMFVILCTQIVLPWGGPFGLIGGLIVTGWYLSFQFKVVEKAAGGEEDLPELTLTEGMLEDVIVPFFKMLVARLIAFAPLIVFIVSLWTEAGAWGFGWAEQIAEEVEANGGPTDAHIRQLLIGVVLLLVGMALWPMVILVLAVGGFGALFRPDLILATIVKTAPAYLMMLGFVVVASLVPAFANQVFDILNPDIGSQMLGAPIFYLLELYGTILAMRAIGLYYHHFKASFAWDWG